MGGRQAVRPRPLEPVSKVRILPAQPVLCEVHPGWALQIDLVELDSAVHRGTALLFFSGRSGSD